MRYPLLTLLACLAMPLAMAQPRASCSSDAQPKPTVLVERFLNADCASCWAEPPAVAAAGRDALGPVHTIFASANGVKTAPI